MQPQPDLSAPAACLAGVGGSGLMNLPAPLVSLTGAAAIGCTALGWLSWVSIRMLLLRVCQLHRVLKSSCQLHLPLQALPDFWYGSHSR